MNPNDQIVKLTVGRPSPAGEMNGITGHTRVSVVIPAYNERDNIPALVAEIRSVCEAREIECEIVIVDDGSTDGTGDAAVQLLDVTVIIFRRNFGQTAAIDAGCRVARHEFIATMDGDGQNDPRDIPKMIEYLRARDLDVVCGWRVDRKDSFAKHFVSRGANVLRKVFLNDSIHDSGCSLKIYRRECFDHLRLYGEMHRFIPALLEMRGFRIGELPVNHRPRVSGKSKYNAFRTIKGLADMMLLWFWRSYAVRPIHLFGSIGVFFLIISMILGMRSVYLFVAGQNLSSTLEPLLTVFTFIAGLLLLILGVLIDILMKIYYSITSEPYYAIRDVVRNGRSEQADRGMRSPP